MSITLLKQQLTQRGLPIDKARLAGATAAKYTRVPIHGFNPNSLMWLELALWENSDEKLSYGKKQRDRRGAGESVQPEAALAAHQQKTLETVQENWVPGVAGLGGDGQ